VLQEIERMATVAIRRDPMAIPSAAAPAGKYDQSAGLNRRHAATD
jgi:hypothetical protein